LQPLLKTFDNNLIDLNVTTAIFALCPAYSLTTFQGFFRAFEEKEPKREKGVFPLKLVLKVGNTVGKLFLCKEIGTQILV
jgi:hypothetical protein